MQTDGGNGKERRDPVPEAEESSVEDDDFDDREDSGTQPRSKKNAQRDEGPACQSCRRKKAKCSRQQPCQQCVRYEIDCVYDYKTAKPGMRAGAIETLTQRIASLENLFLGQGVLWQQVWRCLDSVGAHPPGSDSGCSPGGWSAHDADRPLQEHTAQLKTLLSGLAAADDKHGSVAGRVGAAPPSKKRRIDHGEEAAAAPDTAAPRAAAPAQVPEAEREEAGDAGLPPDDLVDALVNIYFKTFHPWIPMLHERSFRKSLTDPAQRRRLSTILHAIVSLCARFSDDPRLGSADARAQRAKKSRQTVILQSMEAFSVESLQALIICAFDIIGSGSGPSAWSIVGSMTRTVEQLQLSVEEEDQPQSSARGGNTLMKRMAFLPPSRSWVQVEERRRVFWNVFLMDRFSCATTGWNLSLTSADVKRRLPCEGALWDGGEPLASPTPYFGVCDQAAAVPVAASAARPAATEGDGDDDEGLLGGFAYCVEATESLSLVTSFYLRQAVDVARAHDVQVWLLRFKQLDLRLIQWKLFLPAPWREACALNADGIMDPNLTLAHITHNTAVVLLHQGIAYPSAEWQAAPVRLPSALSAETCLAAGTEAAIIAERFLQGTAAPTNPQFAFCLFICGRMLLAHAAYCGAPLRAEFDSLVRSLYAIARRWNGPLASSGDGPNLASKFAARLLQARRLGPKAVDIRQTAYSEDTQHQQQQQQQQQPGEKDEDRPRTQDTILVRNNSVAGNTGFLPSGGFADGDGTTLQADHASMSSMPTEQDGSPGDGMWLAYPPLPLAFALPTAQSSPKAPTQSVFAVDTLPLHDSSARFDGAPTQPGLGPTVTGEAGELGFEDLNSFFESSFLPMQRVSMFSSHDR